MTREALLALLERERIRGNAASLMQERHLPVPQERVAGHPEWQPPLPPISERDAEYNRARLCEALDMPNDYDPRWGAAA